MNKALGMCEMIQKCNIFIIKVSEGEERERERLKILEEIMDEKFPGLTNGITL